MPKYVVEQGDHLAKVAADHGLRLWQTIWDHPSNASIKKLRGNPSVLLPGDELEVPKAQAREETCAVEKRHRFRAKTPALELRVKVLDAARAPVADATATVWASGSFERLTTDRDGMVERPIPLDAREGRLLIEAPELAGTLDVALGIGELDPVDEVTGQIGRLNNLGYDAGPVEAPKDALAQERLDSAIEEFQCDHGLKVDGLCGPATQKKLKEIHGC
jgi:N-acetylmuramoyl-L-alanine amidase